MEKNGEFIDGVSRSDDDMTKVAKVTEGFYAASSKEGLAEQQELEVKVCKTGCKCSCKNK